MRNSEETMLVEGHGIAMANLLVQRKKEIEKLKTLIVNINGSHGTYVIRW